MVTVTRQRWRINVDILKQLTKIFWEVFNDEDIVLTRETTANDIDGWDSFAHLNLIMSIEEFFKIDITDEEAPSLQNIGDLVDLINLKVD